ncbi:MAG: hypothetical protein KF729_30980 [Sandaracinaceae bacterium]|nr:hypothetical protein [Sandaracinaceae bacterium]
MRPLALALTLPFVFLTACDAGAPDDAAVGADAGASDAGGADAGATDGGALDAGATDGGAIDAGPGECPRALAPADRVRRVVVSHPFTDGGDDDRYEVLTLAEDGTLAQPGTTFNMRRASGGEIVFTPDGEIGFVAQSDGSVGVFRLDADGRPTVLNPALREGFYASHVVMDPSGAHAWVLDAQWRESGGGIYRLAIGCDGRVRATTKVAEARLAYAMALRADGRALVAARDILDSPEGADAHLVDLGAPAVRASADAFDDDWIASSAALSANGRHFLVADNAAFSGGDRVAVVGVAGDALSRVQVLSPIQDPVSIALSPFDDLALVVSGFGDAIFVVDYTPDAASPFAVRGPLTYVGARPALPGAAVTITRGALRGLVLVAENVSVRRVRFDGGGAVTDLGAHSVGEGVPAIVGAIGVQP